MYPLLAAGATSVANSLFESLGGMMARKNAASKPADATGSLPQIAAIRKGPTPAEQIATLRAQLLNAPELQTALNTADPTHGASLGIAQDGTVTYAAADGRTSALNLSPATANLARQLSGLLGQSGQSGVVPLTGAYSVRSLNAFA